LARGHLAALAKLDGMGYDVFNLGTGMSYSVLEMVKAFQRASGRPVKYKIAPRRAGDIAECYASPRKAQEKLGWTAELGLDDMCADLWNWQVMNPQGYAADDK
ncbi:MAG: GDP-mannose 4,6-dehydratase, partial [Firmicutes bacterium]|nr:GDP-mannose 4,6-dehydratase [Bacillota bacterium]